MILSRPSVDWKIIRKSIGFKSSYIKDYIFYRSGRDALLAAVNILGLRSGDVIIIPAYICDSAIKLLRNEGYKIVFIDIDDNLQLNLNNLIGLIKNENAKAVLIVHYFGFISDIISLKSILQPMGVNLIEDWCHSFLSQFENNSIGLYGDAAIFSMRKTLPISGGGALLIKNQSYDKSLLRIFSKSRKLDFWYLFIRIFEGFITKLGWPNIYSKYMHYFKVKIRNLFIKDKALLNESFIPQRILPSKILSFYLENSECLNKIKDQIFFNYESLSKGLLDLGLEPYRPLLPKGCIPQWLPLNDPSGLIVPNLREHGIGACHWPGEDLPFEIRNFPDLFPISNQLNRRLALIPVHQSIGSKEISYILRVLSKISGVKKKKN